MPDLTIALLLIGALVAAILLFSARRVTTIYPPNVGLLYRDGRFERELPPGRHALFDPLQRTRIVQLSTAALPSPMPEVTVVSCDQFSFRLGLSPVLQVTDPRAYAESQSLAEPNAFRGFMPQTSMTHPALFSLTTAAALEAVAAHPLRDLLAAPATLADAIGERLATAIPGATVSQLLVTSVTLPPETRRLFTEVERARLEAEASLERARGEQASLRALANAARLIKDNPALANLRFLQTLEQAPGAKTIVLGAGSVPPNLAGEPITG